MRESPVRTLFVLALAPLCCGSLLPQCGSLREKDFTPVSENGFDAADNAQDFNEYPWSMAYFVPDGAAVGHVYVGTGNGVAEVALYLLGAGETDAVPAPPPEIRRYRPDLGPKTWERVLDYRDVESGPQYTSTGFRCMAVYRALNDGLNYLYAATFGQTPSVWRSATGEPGTWDLVWSSQENGSIRWLAPHSGLLYIAVSNELVLPQTPGEIWATDGAAVWPVMQDGFGSQANTSVMSMASYNGWLYAGTANPTAGYEIWRLEGPGEAGQTPVKVLGEGGGDWRNQAAGMPIVFRDALYWGTMILPPSHFKGCDLIRLHQDDSWEYIVGPGGRSGYDSGFTKPGNSYLWWMVEHNGWLYAGTFDLASAFQGILDKADLIPGVLASLPDLPDRVAEFMQNSDTGMKRQPSLLSDLLDAGADLYKSPDGVRWEPVFTNGLGDPYNWGLRTMVSVGNDLYLGMANPFDGLEVWRGTTRTVE